MQYLSNHPVPDSIIAEVGQVVLFTFDEHTAKRANAQRTQAGHASLTGNTVRAGDVVPLMVVRPWGKKTMPYIHVHIADEDIPAGITFPMAIEGNDWLGTPGTHSYRPRLTQETLDKIAEALKESLEDVELAPMPASTPSLNGQAFLDGNDSLWLTSVGEAKFEGQQGCWQFAGVTYPLKPEIEPAPKPHLSDDGK